MGRALGFGTRASCSAMKASAEIRPPLHPFRALYHPVHGEKDAEQIIYDDGLRSLNGNMERSRWMALWFGKRGRMLVGQHEIPPWSPAALVRIGLNPVVRCWDYLYYLLPPPAFTIFLISLSLYTVGGNVVTDDGTLQQESVVIFHGKLSSLKSLSDSNGAFHGMSPTVAHGLSYRRLFLGFWL